MMLAKSLVPKEYERSSVADAPQPRISALLFNFATSLHVSMVPSQKQGARAGETEAEGSTNAPHKGVPMSCTMDRCYAQLAGAAKQGGALRAALMEPLMQQGMLLKWLKTSHLLQPFRAEGVMLLAADMLNLSDEVQGAEALGRSLLEPAQAVEVPPPCCVLHSIARFFVCTSCCSMNTQLLLLHGHALPLAQLARVMAAVPASALVWWPPLRK
jgi:hypothetical protein